MNPKLPLALTVLLLACGCSQTEPPSSPISGVWHVDEVVNLVTGDSTDPENSHFMITDSHIMNVGGKEERPIVKKAFADMSPEEILSQLPASGGFFNYEIKDGNVHRTNKFALSELFEGMYIVTEFETDGATLVFRDDHHADGQMREWRMTRVE